MSKLKELPIHLKKLAEEWSNETSRDKKQSIGYLINAKYYTTGKHKKKIKIKKVK
jgi:hypothetical protein